MRAPARGNHSDMYALSPRPPPLPDSARRKFIKNYLPVILYNNPGIEAAVERSAASNASPSVHVLRTDGTEQTIDCVALNAQHAKGGDRELFRRLTGSDAVVGEAKKRRRRKATKVAAEGEGAEEEGAGVEKKGQKEMR